LRLGSARARAVVVGLGVVLTVTGCSDDPEPPVVAGDLLGEDLAFAASVIPDPASNSVQDIGQLFDATERFVPDEWGSSGYIVLAACSDTENFREATKVQLGVASAAALSKDERVAARAGKYKRDIGCTEGFFR
jgi:hypothetical protein